jgi:hypothetical protein
MKEGRGERIDERGRYFAEYAAEEWQALLAGAGFGGIEIHRMKEERKDVRDQVVRINWLVSLGKVGRMRGAAASWRAKHVPKAKKGA